MNNSTIGRKQAGIARQIRLEAINLDRDVSATAFRVAFFIATYVNGQSGYAWPSQETIARGLGLCVRSVRNAIAELEGQGHVMVERHKGRGQTNKIAFVPATKADVDKLKKSGTEMPVKQAEKRHELADQTPDKPAPECRSTKPKTGNSVPKNRHESADRTFLI